MSTNIKAYGISGSTDALILKPGYPTIQQIGKYYYQITYVYGLAMDQFENLKPEWGSACPLDGMSDHSLLGLSTSVIGPGLIEMTCMYKPGSSSAGYVATPSTHFDAQVTRSVTATTEMRPISDPDLVTSGLYTQPQIDAALADGYKALMVGGLTYQRTKFFEQNTFPWTAAYITQNAAGDVVGSTGTPTGLSGAVSNQWMFTSMNIRDDGDLVELTEEWKFNKVGWKKS